MKTTCYCIYCPKHPLNEKVVLGELKEAAKTNFSPDDLWMDTEYKHHGKEVDCLDPASSFFDELDHDPKDFEFPVTAYGDGDAITGFEGPGCVVYAVCVAEDYRDGRKIENEDGA